MLQKRLLAITLLLAIVFLSSFANAQGYRTLITDSGRDISLCVVKGTPYEMGRSLGELMKSETRNLATRFLGSAQLTGPEYSDASLDKVWAATAPNISKNFRDELRGLADGSGVPLKTLQRVHVIPLVAKYSCSSLCAWGKATANGNLYLTRNLDWEMNLRAHDYPCIVLYLPARGIPHVNMSFAGFIGCNTGMNAAGIALAEMGNAGDKDKPFDYTGYHFTMFFRDILYSAKTLDQALDILKQTKRIKKYHYLFGSGKEKKGVKIRAFAPHLDIWTDNDPKDEYAPKVLKSLVYEDEGRGAFPPLQKDFGKLSSNSMIAITKAIPIKGSNVLGVVYDATKFECWVSYARGDREAYTLPYVHIDFRPYLNFSKPVGKVVAQTGEPSKPEKTKLIKQNRPKMIEFKKEEK